MATYPSKYGIKKKKQKLQELKIFINIVLDNKKNFAEKRLTNKKKS